MEGAASAASSDGSPMSAGYAPPSHMLSTELARPSSNASSNSLAYGSQGKLLDGLAGARSLDGFEEQLEATLTLILTYPEP